MTPKGPARGIDRRPRWVRVAVWVTLFGLAAFVVIDVVQNIR